jgi:hypothetical protein
MMALSWGTPLMKSRSRINRSIRRAPIAPPLFEPMNAKLATTIARSKVLKLKRGETKQNKTKKTQNENESTKTKRTEMSTRHRTDQ